MKKCVLIGGGEVGRGRTTYETKEIDDEIVKMTDKENPTFLFIGLASSFSDSYYDTMKKIYKNLGCTPVYLKKKNMIHNPDLVKEKIENADIIYIAGGDTVKLLEDVYEYHLDSLLREAYERGCVMAGLSAGAILLSREGFSDAKILRGESEKHHFIDGLGFVPISICPHYRASDVKLEELKDELKGSKKKVYGIGNGVALKVMDDDISVIQSIPENGAYLCSYVKKYIEEEI